MWATLDLLVRREARGRDLSENVEEWLEGVNRKIVAASADGEEEASGKKGRKGKKTRSKGVRPAGVPEEVPEAPRPPAHDEDAPRPATGVEEGAEEEGPEEDGGSRKGIRTWNPRKGVRGHDSVVGRRVERLMGTSVVKFTDRNYMMQLQERILESHYESTEKRMTNRRNEEIEREKRLILENKMPVNDSSGLSSHPVFVVRSRMATNPRMAALNASSKKRYARIQDMESAITKQEEQEKRMDAGSRVKKKKRSIRTVDEKDGGSTGASQVSTEAGSDQTSMRVLLDLSEFDEGQEPPETTTGRRLQRTLAEDGGSPEVDRPEGRKVKMTRGPHLDEYADQQELDWEDDGAVTADGSPAMHDSLSGHLGYSPSVESLDEGSQGSCANLSPDKEFERVKYEAPLVKQLRRAETVDQLYELAEQIVGPVPPCAASK